MPKPLFKEVSFSAIFSKPESPLQGPLPYDMNRRHGGLVGFTVINDELEVAKEKGNLLTVERTALNALAHANYDGRKIGRKDDPAVLYPWDTVDNAVSYLVNEHGYQITEEYESVSASIARYRRKD